MKMVKLNATYHSTLTDEHGSKIISFKVDKGSEWVIRILLKKISQLKQNLLTIGVTKFTNNRTKKQNNLMWALIDLLQKHIDGGRTDHDHQWDLYLQYLQRFGCKYEYMMILPEALDFAEKAFRAVQVVQEVDHHGKKWLGIKAFYGSSDFNTKQMADLIDGILDDLHIAGLEDQTLLNYYEKEWKGMKQ